MIDTLLQRFPGAKKNGEGYRAICPSHPDKTPSLSISQGGGGKVLLHCHAGCEIETILAAVGLTAKDLSPVSAPAVSRIIATYDYKDETGTLLFQAVRSEPKRFFQRRPNGAGWTNNLEGVRRVLYRLPELLKADISLPVFIVEGEKDVDNLRSRIGVIATCNPAGAGKWKNEYCEFLKGRRCVILPDNDDVGEQHANTVARSLLNHADSVSVLHLPGLPEKGDVSDWLTSGNTLEDLNALLTGVDNLSLEDFDGTPDAVAASPSYQYDPNKKETQADRLMKLASGLELFHTSDGETFATVPVNSHLETYPIKSRDLRDWLTLRYWNAARSMPSSQAVQNVVDGLSGRAKFEGELRGVHLRVAEHGEAIYVDLGNDRWEAVKITCDGWDVVAEPPIKFRRTRGTEPLPRPERGGNISDLSRFANVAEDDWPLVLSWLAATLRPNKPFPVLVLHGEQGSGKSTTAKVLRLLVDPNKSPLRSSPKDERDLMIAANNSWIISLDNLSSMTVALSDSLCRLSTGGGFATRELFSDGDEILLSLTRPVILNGIDEVISRSDLLDRSIMMHLPRVAARSDETTFWGEFELARPKILGALFDAVANGIRNVKDVTISTKEKGIELPRLADFTLWGMACENGFGLTPGSFFERYKDNRAGVHDLALDGDPFAEAVLAFMAGRSVWKGTSSRLFSEIIGGVNEGVARSRGFPKSAQGIGRRLSLLAPNLREHGVEYNPPDRSKRDRDMTLSRVRSVENDVS